jgi:hypothetical protein
MSHIIIFNQKQQYKIQDGGEILLDWRIIEGIPKNNLAFYYLLFKILLWWTKRRQQSLVLAILWMIRPPALPAGCALLLLPLLSMQWVQGQSGTSRQSRLWPVSWWPPHSLAHPGTVQACQLFFQCMTGVEKKFPPSLTAQTLPLVTFSPSTRWRGSWQPALLSVPKQGGGKYCCYRTVLKNKYIFCFLSCDLFLTCEQK